mmetsp:Transcript_16821/g.37845  ORF Transcript_16821/g.37845 Transcript_16821/m.37845 type:complete len:269 (+) Transcript_16821:615-1421(+)
MRNISSNRMNSSIIKSIHPKPIIVFERNFLSVIQWIFLRNSFLDQATAMTMIMNILTIVITAAAAHSTIYLKVLATFFNKERKQGNTIIFQGEMATMPDHRRMWMNIRRHTTMYAPTRKYIVLLEERSGMIQLAIIVLFPKISYKTSIPIRDSYEGMSLYQSRKLWMRGRCGLKMGMYMDFTRAVTALIGTPASGKKMCNLWRPSICARVTCSFHPREVFMRDSTATVNYWSCGMTTIFMKARLQDMMTPLSGAVIHLLETCIKTNVF